MTGRLDTRSAVRALKAAADPTRLRILLLLAGGELNVKDLTRILGQSQPRISRHLKLLVEAGLVERFREGSWAYFHLPLPADATSPAVPAPADALPLGRLLVAAVDGADPAVARDRERAEALKAEREIAAQAYFREHAPEWDRIRSLHVTEAEVEAAMRDALGPGRIDLLVDLGTGTGRMLELFAGSFDRGLGLDANQSMLAYARSKLDRSRLAHAQVRHGDIYDVPLPDGAAGVVVMHQVLHFLADPGHAVREAARLLRPGGRLLIADFAPHEIDFLRETCAHQRLGFARAQVAAMMSDAGLALGDYRELAPPSGSAGSGKLTVSIWLGTKASGREPARASSQSTPTEKAA